MYNMDHMRISGKTETDRQTASKWQPMGGIKGEVCPVHHMASGIWRVGPVNRLIIPVRSSSSVFVLK